MLLIRIPQLSINMPSQVTILRWYRQKNEAIGQGVLLVDLKIGSDIFSLSSPKSGMIEKIMVSAGETAEINDVIAILKDTLPVFDPEAELTIEPTYKISAEELSISAQVALQQRLIEKSSSYANRIQSLPPKWSPLATQPLDEYSGEMEMTQTTKIHPLLKDKCWRKEEHQHPSDLSGENLKQAELRYNLQYQPRPSPAPTPRPC